MLTIKAHNVGEIVEVEGQTYQIRKVEGSVAFLSKCTKVDDKVVLSKGRPTKVNIEFVTEE